MKGCEYLKKILLAWIEQRLEFDSESECDAYIMDVKKSGKAYMIKSKFKDKGNGKVRIQIRKQYNNNNFPGNSGKKEGD